MLLTQQRIVLHAETVYATASDPERSVDGIIVDGLPSGAEVYASDIDQKFIYDATSVVPPSLNAVIRPLIGPGRWIVESAGAFTVPHYYSVGTGGDVDFTSIATAIAAAIGAGASAANPYEIQVYPGTYTEPPMTVPAGIVVSTNIGDRADLVYVIAQNPNQDLFTVTGGTLAGLRLQGVTDPVRALVRVTGLGNQASLRGIAVRNCSTGVAVSAGATAALTNFTCLLTGPAMGVTTALSVTGAGSTMSVVGGVFLVPAAVAALYAVNPIQTCIRVADQSNCVVANANFDVAFHDLTADLFLCDGTSETTLGTVFMHNSANAIHIGAVGADTIVTLLGGWFENNQENFVNDSATGEIFNLSSATTRKYVFTPGAKLLGLIQNRAGGDQRILGHTFYNYVDQDVDLDLDDYFNDFSATGVSQRGDVADAGGLTVNVPAGDGFISRLPPFEDAKHVTWDPVLGLVLADNTTNYVVYDDATSAIVSQLGPASQTQILLATVVTKGGDIQYLHTTYTPVDRVQQLLAQYFEATRRVAWNSGLACTQGTSVRKLTIGGGDYWIALTLLPYAGGTDVTFNNFWGPGGASESAGVTQLDITNYDNAGVLTAMTAGWYRCDSVILTSDGRVSVIYGTAQFLTDTDAEAQGFAAIPSFIEPTACPIARVVVQQGVGIHAIFDARPVAVWTAGSSSGAPITVHSALAGLTAPADDHTQYLLVTGVRAMSGALNMGANPISNVGTVDGVTVSAHAARHDPGGADALTVAAPIAVLAGVAPAIGAAASFALSDHQHGIATGVPQTIGTANAAGGSSSVPRLDHVHDHGAQSTSNHHAVGSDVRNGFVTALPGVGSPNTALLSADGQTQSWIPISDAYVSDLAWGKITGTPTTLAGYGITDAALAATTMTAGAGLTGGGDLSANRTFDVGANADGSITVNANDIQVGVLATDAQHGNRGGGALHALANNAANGFAIALGGVANRVLLTTDGTTQSWGQVVDAMISGVAWGKVTGTPTTLAGYGITDAALAATTMTAGAGLTGGGDLSANRTFNVGANADGSITVNANDIQVGVLATDAQHGNRGGGLLHAAVTNLAAGFVPLVGANGTILQSTGAAANWVTVASLNLVPQARTLTAGAGLTGGGDLSANRTFDVGANADGSITVNANDIQVGVLATDAQHGNRGGGLLHAAVTNLAAGFVPLVGANGTILQSTGAAANWVTVASLNLVPQARTITTTAPLTIDGGASADLSANRTLAITAASGAAAGTMSAADFTKLAGIRAAATSALLLWGNGDIATTTTTRFLSPGWEDTVAPTTTIQFAVAFPGTLKNLRIHCGTAPGNGNPVVYTLRVNGVASALTVSLASNVANGSDLAHSVAVVAGDLLDIIVTKAAGIGTTPTNIMASLEMSA